MFASKVFLEMFDFGHFASQPHRRARLHRLAARQPPLSTSFGPNSAETVLGSRGPQVGAQYA